MTATQAAANTDPAAITPTKRSRRILVALFVTGFGAFLNLYATQPLLPQFRQLFHASELLVSMTVSAPRPGGGFGRAVDWAHGRFARTQAHHRDFHARAQPARRPGGNFHDASPN